MITSARDPHNGITRFTDAMLAHSFDLDGNLESTAEVAPLWLAGGPSARMRPDGQFVMVWQESNYYGSERRLVGRRFPDGAAQQLIARRLPLSEDAQPSVAVGGDHEFLVVWRNEGIAGRWYSRDFNVLGPAEHVANQGSSPRAAIAENGNVVVVWERRAARRARGGIFGRRFLTDP